MKTVFLRTATTAAFAAAFSLLLALLSSGCATKRYSQVPLSRAGPVQSVDPGVVLSVRHFVYDGYPTMLGVSAGGITGSAVGQSVGQGSGQIVGGAVGAVVGMVAGAHIEKEMTTQTVQEVTVRLESGELVVVTQELKEPGFIQGDLVIVTRTHYGHAFVKHAHLDD